MKTRRISTALLIISILSAMVMTVPIPRAHALPNSTKVAYVVSPGHNGCEGLGGTAALGYADPIFHGCSVFVNAITSSVPPGGVYTTSSGNIVTFTNVPAGTIDTLGLAAISGFDTVFLYMVCDIASHPGLVSALNTYLTNGLGKVVIYDGDKCSTAAGYGIDPVYTTFLFPFKSNNPGPLGAAGTITLVETETPPATLTRTITTGFVGPGNVNDAVGDSNTFTSNTGGWCAAIKGTNVNGANDTQVAYARTSTGGLAIYNGQDNWATDGTSADFTFDRSVFENILDQPFNPDSLPCGIPVTGIKLDPMSATNNVGSLHTVTATVTNVNTGSPVPGVTVTFTVKSGPNTGTTGTGVSNTSGQATFTYSGTGGSGTDTIVASFTDSSGKVHLSNTVIKVWTIPPLKVSKFFTDTSLNPLPLDQFGNPKVDVVLSNGVVKSTNPGEIMAWVNLTNLGPLSVESLKVKETLPIDWIVAPHWIPSHGAIHVFYQNSPSLATNLEITDPTTISVSTGNPETVFLAIPSLSSTAIGHSLLPGQTILLEVKLDYGLDGTAQSAASFPRVNPDTASATGWTMIAFTGTQMTGSATGSFIAYAKVVG